MLPQIKTNYAAAVFFHLLSLCLCNITIEFLIKELIINIERQQRIPHKILLVIGCDVEWFPFV